MSKPEPEDEALWERYALAVLLPAVMAKSATGWARGGEPITQQEAAALIADFMVREHRERFPRKDEGSYR